MPELIFATWWTYALTFLVILVAQMVYVVFGFGSGLIAVGTLALIFPEIRDVVVVLLLVVLASLLAASMLFMVNVDLKTSRVYADSIHALTDTDSAIQEVIWRLNLTDGISAPPAGSTISVNDLVDYNAKIDYDPNNLLSNYQDDDGDNVIDDFNEIDPTVDWTTRILLSTTEPNPGAPLEVTDTDMTQGPPFGSWFVEATIQDEDDWRLYSTVDYTTVKELLTVRFKTDEDTSLGDSEGDGREIVFYDPDLALNYDDDKISLIGLGGDGDHTGCQIPKGLE